MSLINIEPAEDHQHQHTTGTVDLPVEILSEIFTRCTGDEYVHENQEFDPNEAPLLLMRICRRWRSVALSTPALWATLPPIGIRHILPWSGMDKLFRIIAVSHLHRAGKLRITYAMHPNLSPLDRLFINFRGKFELLTHLHIDCNYNTNPTPHFDIFEHAPRLRSVSGQPQGLTLPWSQIQHYTGILYDIGSASRILRLYTQLETLSLSFLYGPTLYEEDEPTTPLFFPHLLELQITDEIGTMDQLIFLLHAPLLEVIQISEVSHDLPIPSALITRLTHSRCASLTSLQLLCSVVDARELHQLAGLAPGLRELDIYLTPDAFRKFAYSSVAPNIFPRLVRLIVHRIDIEDRGLIRILRSRISPSSYNALEGCQVERLRYCQVYPIAEKDKSAGAARRLWNAVEHQIHELAQEGAITDVEWIVQEDEHGWYTLVWRSGVEQSVESRFKVLEVDANRIWGARM
ncbi:hypothetical protein BD779DRAFT_1542009 [Infundibulicybe gibba]|nr:hypothetical protein BD779DRAFT_1542009 [Infundibulicybe gibba]